MKVALRAATHLDFTQFVPGTGSRYGAVVSSYYTLAWFDRYLRGQRGALGRLLATRFDRSADVHNISGGAFDPRTGQNVPARIAGQPVVNRLSFHFRSAYFVDGGRPRCDDMRAGCPAAPPKPIRGKRCTRPRFTPKTVRVRRDHARFRPRVTCSGRARSVVVRLRLRSRSVNVVSGRAVTLRVPEDLRRIRATFSVDGRRHGAWIKLR